VQKKRRPPSQRKYPALRALALCEKRRTRRHQFLSVLTQDCVIRVSVLIKAITFLASSEINIFIFNNCVPLADFISKNEGEHIRGSECDQKILSKKESRGVVYSPNYPFPYIPKIVCRYFIYGMQDMQHLERVRLSFDKFDIPRGQKGECVFYFC
jgi:hypothetical protein